jgi:hypothetical protein
MASKMNEVVMVTTKFNPFMEFFTQEHLTVNSGKLLLNQR